MDKDDQINVKNVPAELKRRAQKKAIDEGRSLSDVLRELLEEYAEAKPKPQQQVTK